MITESTARRLLILTVTCVALFLMGSGVAYAQRGYVAVGGEYVFCLIPAAALWFEAVRGGDM